MNPLDELAGIAATLKCRSEYANISFETFRGDDDKADAYYLGLLADRMQEVLSVLQREQEKIHLHNETQ